MDGDTPVRITIETAIDDEHAETFYQLYLAAFGPLRTRAAARQVLHKNEFFAEMTDARVWKYVAWADEDTPIAMTTITKSLDTVPWISPGVLPEPASPSTQRGTRSTISVSAWSTPRTATHGCSNRPSDWL